MKKGSKHTLESLAKMSASHSTPEILEKMRDFRKSPEFREQCSRTMKKRFENPEERKKHSEGMKEYFKKHPERRAEIRTAFLGKNNRFWKGEELISSDGYRLIYLVGRCKNHAYEHRLVAERVLGRSLKKNEIVHHINGDKLDNRNKNLLICSQGYHLWLEHKMSDLYKQEHFARKAIADYEGKP